MTAISISDIQQDLAGYLRRVQSGETLVITDHDQPIAEIKPIARPAERKRPFGLCAGEFQAPDDFDAPLADPKVLQFLESRIQDAKVPARWQHEGVADPSDACQNSSLQLAEQLFAEHGLLPSKVVASRQEGIYLEYKSPHGGQILGIEVDNELDIVAVVSDAHEVLASGAFEADKAQELLRIFLNGLAKSAGDPRPANS